jgi:hypothetical protein
MRCGVTVSVCQIAVNISALPFPSSSENIRCITSDKWYARAPLWPCCCSVWVVVMSSRRPAPVITSVFTRHHFMISPGGPCRDQRLAL